MTPSQMHTAVKLGLDKTSSLDIPAYEPEEIDLWLNVGQDRFIKQRLFGNNPKGVGFEGDSKRISDLQTLVVNKETDANPWVAVTKYPNTTSINLGTTETLTISGITAANPGVVTVVAIGDLENSDSVIIKDVGGMVEVNNNEYVVANIAGATFEISNTVGYTAYTAGGKAYRRVQAGDFMYYITSRSKITRTYPTITAEYIDNIMIEHADINKFISTGFNSPRFKNPVCWIEDNLLYIMHDDLTSSYDDATWKFSYTYIKQPTAIDNVPADTTSCELATSTHQEIVDITVDLMIENIESARTQTHTEKLKTQE